MSDLVDAWKDSSIPQRHWDVIANERRLVAEGRTKEVAPYRAIHECFEAIAERLLHINNCRCPQMVSVLEIGAATGFYDRVLKSLGWNKVFYTAVDYSTAFKDFAAKVHPDINFIVGDATNLVNVDTSSYGIVISGCCMLHIEDWKAAMREAVRVAKSYVIFHRTPLIERPTFTFQKEAYGVICSETWFNRKEFYNVVADLGLKVIKEVEVFNRPQEDFGHFSIVCEK